jgi:peptidoglycan DL-endopeptidase CwlO
VSLAEVSTRIAQIQSMLAPPRATTSSTAAGTSSTSFADSLSSALGSSSTSSSSTSGTTADGDDLAAFASTYAGVRYVAGGRSPQTGWDCAGFTQWVAKQYGIDIPDVSWQQIKTGTAVSDLSQAKPGDLLFFHEPGGHHHDPSSLGVNHVAIYLGDGKMVEAANPRAGTRIGPVDTQHLVGIRRIAAPGDGVARTPAEVAAAISTGGVSAAAVRSTAATTSVGARPTGALSPRELVSVLEKAGFKGEGLRTAWAVAMRESHGRPGALSPANSNGTRDHGLFQLNDIHLGRSIDASQVYDAAANAAAAYRMTKHGTDWSSWGIGHTGWARHLEQVKPETYRMLNARFQEWYDRFPGA